MSFYDALLFSKGQRGERGYSAYEIAVQEGYEGTQEEWANSFLSPTGYYTKAEVDNIKDSQDEIIDKKPYYFDNLSDMKSYNLQTGDYVNILGDTTKNDGFLRNYTIVDDSNLVADDNDIVELNNGLYGIRIKDSMLKFHAVANSSSAYVIQFPNGKNMFIDTGTTSQWENIRVAIANLGINHFDYGVITHFHSDHYGNLQNYINAYNLSSNTKIWVQMKPDFINHSEDLDETEANYDNQINLLLQNGITPIVPENNSYYQIDKDIKLRFLNTSTTIAENYYDKNAEWYTHGKINFNYFSLVTEIIHKNVRILSTGDIEAGVEEQLSPYLQKCNILLIPHHGTNRDAYIPFYRAVIPEFAIALFPTTDNNWVRTEMKGFMQLKNQGCKMITTTWSRGVNGLFSFFSDGDIVSSNVLDGGIRQGACEDHTIFAKIDELIDFSKRLPSKITLNQLLNNMPVGSYLSAINTGNWYNSEKPNDESKNKYKQIYLDIEKIFGVGIFQDGMRLEVFRDAMTTNTFTIKIGNGLREFTAFSQGGGAWRVSGSGSIPNATNIESLLTSLKKYPRGNYKMWGYKETTGDSPLLKNTTYILDITIDSRIIEEKEQNGETITITNFNAYIIASLRSTLYRNNSVLQCYINTQNDPQYIWTSLNPNPFLGDITDTTETVTQNGIQSTVQLNGTENLIKLLSTLHSGHYTAKLKDNSGFLENNLFYSASIDILSSKIDDNSLVASVIAILRSSTAGDDPNKVQTASCYINTNTNPQYVWHKLNN